ncbi:MAG: LacI family DNA-binding transcriptional regulator [Pontiellaceae bacterium]|nr:LacI family DNA-binding transcriptional regulator [Pontiellaceae bacterium]MBN2785859.1 LacI family DNA-binding transcriptional regulator [Pontiellaceae bacterium]
MSTMSEIAKTAGVSRHTVSKVLNGTHVTEETYATLRRTWKKGDTI